MRSTPDILFFALWFFRIPQAGGPQTLNRGGKEKENRLIIPYREADCFSEDQEQAQRAGNPCFDEGDFSGWHHIVGPVRS
jgi:hypothetical protein